MIVIGLTGSIGMGKIDNGRDAGISRVPVHDADESVHKLLRYDSEAWLPLAAAFPYFSYPQIYGRRHFFNPFKETVRFLKRDALGKIVFKNSDERKKLEDILHPFVRKAQNKFIRRQRGLGRDMVALDIPLLFETGADTRVDYTINVTAPKFVQAARVLARPGMNKKKLAGIIKSQMPDGEKSARADFIVHTGLGRAQTMRELKAILAKIRNQKEEDTA